MQPGLKRSDPCPCGSGLRYKKCHGNAAIINGCTTIAQYMMLKLITEARYNAKLIDELEYRRIVDLATKAMIRCANGGVPNENIDDDDDDGGGHVPDETPKDIVELQKDLERCPTCGRPTFGKECIRCKRQEKKGE